MSIGQAVSFLTNHVTALHRARSVTASQLYRGGTG